MLQAKQKYLQQSVRYLKGVGPKRSEALIRLGIETIEDLFYFFPRRYEDRSHFIPIKEIQPGSYATVKGDVLTSSLRRIKRMTLFEMVLGDDSGFLYATWFNQPYLKRQFEVGDAVILSGKVDWYNNRLQMNVPDYEVLSESGEDMLHSGRVVPIYPLTEGLGQRGIRRAMKELVDQHLQDVNEFMPLPLMQRLHLMDLQEAIQNIHFPSKMEVIDKAKERLIFDEFFLFEIALLERIHKNRLQYKAAPLAHGEEIFQEFQKSLPFILTRSQQEILGEMARDLSREIPMRRLLQGDVGSGKTVVAAGLLLLAARNHAQSALLVPTEVLAEQHYQTLGQLLEPFRLKVVLLTGAVQGQERGEILADMRNHKVDVAVGTHALIQEGIKFSKLGLVVIDEQHKFGVRQRAALLAGQIRPHLLVMTATPIPRTLGLTLYGDLDISTLNELPQGRKPIQTYWITKAREPEILRHVRERVDKGEQAYIVFPVIEETEKSDLAAATKEYEVLRRGIFQGVGVGLIHGRLSKWDKERVMKDFKEGSIQVLVSTTVVEVGIDNPNATVMVVEHAERFGLSQLHQLRGRIGRGSRESICFLFGDPPTEEGKRRLRILTKTTDGFKIAEEDLILRGPGDFLGTRQSGLPFFRLGDLIRDGHLLKLARQEAMALLEQDGELAHFEALRERVNRESKWLFDPVKD